MSEPESAEAFAARICTQDWWHGDGPEDALAAAIREDRALTLEWLADRLWDLDKDVACDCSAYLELHDEDCPAETARLVRAEAARVRQQP